MTKNIPIRPVVSCTLHDMGVSGDQNPDVYLLKDRSDLSPENKWFGSSCLLAIVLTRSGREDEEEVH